METLILDGKKYVKAATAARTAGYTADYVGQLCRKGLVDAQLVGRSWYVNQDDLATHQSEKKRMSRTKAREQAHRAAEEARKAVRGGAEKNFERHITYEGDDSELIPHVKKISVEAESVRPKKAAKNAAGTNAARDEEPKITFENKGEKVQMSGDIEVVDATDEQFMGAGTVIMEPEIEKGQPVHVSEVEPSAQKKPQEVHSQHKDHEQQASQQPPQKEEEEELTTFIEKLALLDEDVSSSKGSTLSKKEQGAADTKTERPAKAARPARTMASNFLILASLVIAAAALSLEKQWSYSYSQAMSAGSVDTDYRVAIPQVF